MSEISAKILQSLPSQAERSEAYAGVSCCHKLSLFMRKIHDFFFTAKYRTIEEVPVCYLAMLPENDPQEMVALRQEMRRRFLQYFKDRSHAVIASSPVVPHDDPTLLFINSHFQGDDPF